MTACRRIAALIAFVVITPASARIANYVETASSPNDPDEIALGFPVPIPRDQSAAFAGFRSLDGLMIRSAELAAADKGPRLTTLGHSRDGRAIQMLCFGPDEPMQVLQNGGIHAREWASPEAVMGLAEALTLEREQPLISWVADQVPSCLIPVFNPDGFAQTQREATLTRICEASEQPGAGDDCDAAEAYPRDGRMRRKNLGDESAGTGSDGNIETADDSLLGVDLNRNFPPYWASSDRSSNNKQDVVYHGPSASSEPETTLLVALQESAEPDQLRLFVDTHSFSQLYFWNCTGRRLLDQTANDWIERFRLAARSAYASVPAGNPNTGAGCGEFGIGASDELFAYQANIPSYTLEIEPDYEAGASQYDGNSVSHDGFILPESIVPLMREDVVNMMVLAYSMTAGPAWIESVSIQASTESASYQGSWVSSATTRDLLAETQGEFQPGDTITLMIDFDRPMRARADDGSIGLWPGQTPTLNPQVRLKSGNSSWSLDTQDGLWVEKPNGYDTQRFVLESQIPDNWKPGRELRLFVDAEDNAGIAIDADPAQVPQWSNGHFSNIETGSDKSHLVAVGTSSSGGSGGSLGSSLLVILCLMSRRLRGRRTTA